MNCTIDNCPREARYTFVWPWAADGACCEDHKMIVLQRSTQTRGRIGGRVTFVPLDPDRPREVTRDERIALHSSRLTAESERDDARLRSAKLLEANTALTNELRLVRARLSQFEANAVELRDQYDGALRERDHALLRLETIREEAARLGVVVGEGEPSTVPDLPGNVSHHVVE